MKCILITVSITLWAALACPVASAQIRASAPADTPYAAPAPCPTVKVSSVTPLGHFLRFTNSSLNWKTVVSPALTAGLARLSGRDDGFQNNLNGYARHYGADVLGNVSGKFFGSFVLPTLLQQDEKFEGRGSSSRWLDRVTHALPVWVGQSFVPLNVSGLGASRISAILSNAYLPQSQRTTRATAIRFGLNTASYVAGDAYMEFSPDLEHALKKLGAIVLKRKPSRFLTAPTLDYSKLAEPQRQLVPAEKWRTWHQDQELEFAGATQALNNWCRSDPGMYGYDQNKANDGFLGLVVLFNHNDPTKGQFHSVLATVLISMPRTIRISLTATPIIANGTAK